MTVCPVLESIRVVTGSQRQDTVFAFSFLVTTQCSMTSEVGGGIMLRTGTGGGGWGGGGGCRDRFLLGRASNQAQEQNEPQILHARNSKSNWPTITLRASPHL